MLLAGGTDCLLLLFSIWHLINAALLLLPSDTTAHTHCTTSASL
jgi:hypothetical protein